MFARSENTKDAPEPWLCGWAFTEAVTGTEFVARYFRHVPPLGLRTIRRYGFCHPAAKATRECIASRTGCTIVLETTPASPAPRPACPCCGAR